MDKTRCLTLALKAVCRSFWNLLLTVQSSSLLGEARKSCCCHLAGTCAIQVLVWHCAFEKQPWRISLSQQVVAITHHSDWTHKGISVVVVLHLFSLVCSQVHQDLPQVLQDLIKIQSRVKFSKISLKFSKNSLIFLQNVLPHHQGWQEIGSSHES